MTQQNVSLVFLHKHREVLENWIFNSQNDDLFEDYYWSISPVDFNVTELSKYLDFLCSVVVQAERRSQNDVNCDRRFYQSWYPVGTLSLFRAFFQAKADE